MLMPEGLTDEVLRERARTLAEVCKREGLRLSPGSTCGCGVRGEACDVSAPDAAGRRAVVLLSGGLDSTTCLAWALDRNFACTTLAVDYGQRIAPSSTSRTSRRPVVRVRDHREVTVDLRAIGGSSLTSETPVPKDRDERAMSAGIPSTYVPARNTVFLAIALGLAETIGARDLIAGMNAIDYSGYPDCRPEFVRAFEALAQVATKAGALGERFTIHTPLMSLDKAGIVRLGASLGVDYALTHSCYDPAEDGGACGRCDACRLRARGFREAGVPDPTRYAPGVITRPLAPRARAASTLNGPPPHAANASQMKQYSITTSPWFCHHQMLPLPAAWIQKYATAISPEAMKAARCVNSPITISAPHTTSITPAAPNRLASCTVPWSGPMPPNQPNSFCAPWLK
jgi:7-cyano-7-deazaguanine synthase